MEARLTESNRAGIQDTSRPHSLAYAGLYLFTLLLYLRPNEMFPGLFGALPITKAVALFAILAYVASKLLRGESLTIWPLELKMVALIVLLGILFIPLAASPQDSITMLTDPFLKVVLIFVLMINLLDTRKRLLSILKLVVVCGTVMACLALASYIEGNFNLQGIRIAGAVGGTFGNPNDMATNFDLLLPVAVSLALLSRGLQRLIYFICSVLLTAGVVVTFSRGGFLGLAAAAVVLLWKLGRRNRVTMALAFAALFAAFVIVVPSEYSGRLTSIFEDEQDTTGSRQERKDLLVRAIAVAASHPVVGVGIGNYHIYSLREQVAHNSYLEISAELGILGLVAYITLIFAPLRSLRRIERKTADWHLSHAPPETESDKTYHYLSIALQAAFVAYIVCSFFGSIQYLWYLYYIVGYAIALRRIQPELLTADASQETENVGVLWKEQSRPRIPVKILASQPINSNARVD